METARVRAADIQGAQLISFSLKNLMAVLSVSPKVTIKGGEGELA